MSSNQDVFLKMDIINVLKWRFVGLKIIDFCWSKIASLFLRAKYACQIKVLNFIQGFLVNM
jgi:hypothetical protein